MENNDLKDLLNLLEETIDNEISVLIDSSSLKPIFSLLVKISILDDAYFDNEIIDRLDILTDNLDALNLGCVKENIHELNELL